jgi:hypothetical protein
VISLRSNVDCDRDFVHTVMNCRVPCVAQEFRNQQSDYWLEWQTYDTAAYGEGGWQLAITGHVSRGSYVIW